METEMIDREIVIESVALSLPEFLSPVGNDFTFHQKDSRSAG